MSSARAAGQIIVDTAPLSRIKFDHLPERPNVALVTLEHQVVAIGSNGRTLVWYDANGKQSWKKTISPNASGGISFFFSMLHGSHGRIDVWDHLQGRLTSIDAAGRERNQRRLNMLPTVSIGGGGRSSQYLVMLGKVSTGEIIARTSFDPGASAITGLHEDSADIVVIDRQGVPQVVHRALMAEQFRRNAPYLIQGTLPFGRVGAVGVGGDSWYYTDGSQFTIERRAIDGTLTSTFGSSRSRRAVAESDIRTSRLRTLAEIDSVLKPSMVSTLAWMPYPETMPAYADLHVDSEGVLWAEVFAPAWESGHWDLFDQAGKQLGTVSLPPGLRVLDIVKDALLAYHEEPGVGAELRIYRLVRT